MFLDREGVDWKEGDCQVICGRVRSEGFLCRDKLKSFSLKSFYKLLEILELHKENQEICEYLK